MEWAGRAAVAASVLIVLLTISLAILFIGRSGRSCELVGGRIESVTLAEINGASEYSFGQVREVQIRKKRGIIDWVKKLFGKKKLKKNKKSWWVKLRNFLNLRRQYRKWKNKRNKTQRQLDDMQKRMENMDTHQTKKDEDVKDLKSATEKQMGEIKDDLAKCDEKMAENVKAQEKMLEKLDETKVKEVVPEASVPPPPEQPPPSEPASDYPEKPESPPESQTSPPQSQTYESPPPSVIMPPRISRQQFEVYGSKFQQLPKLQIPPQNQPPSKPKRKKTRHTAEGRSAWPLPQHHLGAIDERAEDRNDSYYEQGRPVQRMFAPPTEPPLGRRTFAPPVRPPPGHRLYGPPPGPPGMEPRRVPEGPITFERNAFNEMPFWSQKMASGNLWDAES